MKRHYTKMPKFKFSCSRNMKNPEIQSVTEIKCVQTVCNCPFCSTGTEDSLATVSSSLGVVTALPT